MVSDGPCRHTFRDLDHALGLSKGSAFRAFKRVRAKLREGADYRVLAPHTAAAEIESLRASGRIYPASINVVLLTDDARAQVEAILLEST